MEATKAPELLTILEVAKLLRVNASTIDRWVAEGRFPKPFKLGGAIKRFSSEEVEAHLAKSRSDKPFAARNPTPKTPCPSKSGASAGHGRGKRS